MTRSRSSTKAVVALLSASPLPVYLVDEHRRIIFCNAACAAWAGVDAAQLMGRRCDYHSGDTDDELSRIAAWLCPPPESLQGQRVSAIVSAPRAAGVLARRRAEFLPLGTDALECPGVVVVLGDEDLESADPGGAAEPATESHQLHQRLQAFRSLTATHYQLQQLIGDSPAMRRVREQAEIAAFRTARVLILGPPGSGREHVARTIHYGAGGESAGALTPLSCSLLDAELLRSTITAFLRQYAELETEQPGALLLLDVDELARDAQAVLADAVQIAEFNVGTLSTARQGLLQLADDGKYRRDLAHALSTLTIELPPLAERQQDIPLLTQFFVERHNEAGGRQLSGFTPEAIDELVAYPWPGNVDELEELVQRACRRAEGAEVGLADLPDRIRWTAHAAAHPPREPEEIELDKFMDSVESELIRRALQRSQGNKAKAARLLGVTRARLSRRAAHFGLA